MPFAPPLTLVALVVMVLVEVAWWLAIGMIK